MTLAQNEKEIARIALHKAGHMLVAAHAMFVSVKDINANIPVCIETGLAFVGYAKETLENIKLEMWDQREIEKRICGAYEDAKTQVYVGKMMMRMLLSKDHYKWEEYERAEKMIHEYATKGVV